MRNKEEYRNYDDIIPNPKQRQVERFVAQYIEEHDWRYPDFKESEPRSSLPRAAAFYSSQRADQGGRATKGRHALRSFTLTD